MLLLIEFMILMIGFLITQLISINGNFKWLIDIIKNISPILAETFVLFFIVFILLNIILFIMLYLKLYIIKKIKDNKTTN